MFLNVIKNKGPYHPLSLFIHYLSNDWWGQISRPKDKYDDKYIVLYNLNAIYEAIGAQLMFKLQNILYTNPTFKLLF